jgi:hypothetical protein
MAIVHVAVYDAVNAIDPTHEPYADGRPRTRHPRPRSPPLTEP